MENTNKSSSNVWMKKQMDGLISVVSEEIKMIKNKIDEIEELLKEIKDYSDAMDENDFKQHEMYCQAKNISVTFIIHITMI